AQTITLFYADTNNSLWALATVGGFFAFLLIGTFTIFGPAAGFIVLIALAVLSAVLIRYYYHPVPEGFVGVVYSFGKYSRTLYAGLNILFPWERKIHHLKVKEVQWLCPMQRIQLSHDYDVVLRATISYQLHPGDAHLVMAQTDRWESSLRELFVTTLQTISTAFSPDDFISWPDGLQTPPADSENIQSLARRESINNYLYQQVRDKVALWGVIVHWVSMRDIMLTPHNANIQTEILLSTPPTLDPEEQTQPKVTLPAQREAPLHLANDVPKTSEQVTIPSAPPSVLAPPRLPSEEVLVKAYKEVKDGKITDPETIREIAASFKAVADDPQASQAVSFDAERAAANLYEQAEKYENTKEVK
ncbi:MAG TPA: SPFH domain-containing protein, partial [Ktedonobacteraceae bacterium]